MDKQKKHYKLVVRGGYGLGNFGDDALMIEIYNFFIKWGFSNNEIAFNCYYDDYLYNLIPNVNLIDIDDKNFSFDNYIYGGGTQFYSFNNNSFDFSKKIKILLKYFIKTFKPRNYKVFGLGLGLGPFLDPLKEFDTRTNLIKADGLWLRDPKSLDYCKKWKIKNSNTGTDICNIIQFDINKKKDNRIGLILRDWKDEKSEDYYKSVIELIKYFIDNKIEFDPIIFSDRKDLLWEKKLVELGIEYLKWNPLDNNPYDSFIKKLNNYSLIITSRFHGAIFSALLDIPFITIAIEPKLKMISELYKNGSFSWKAPYDLFQILKQISQIKENHYNFKKSIISIRKQNNSDAIKMFDELLKKLK